MKKLISALAAFLLLVSGQVCLYAAAASPSVAVQGTADEGLWLTLSTNRTGARYFVDVNGQPVRLFGMARCQSHAGEEDLMFSSVGSSQALTRHYADLGCNFMRLAINLKDLEAEGDYSAQAINRYITNRIDPDVQTIIGSGMYVMLDIHMYPPAQDSARKVVEYAYEHYIPVLVELAKKYADEPRVAVIELWNEPYPADQTELGFEMAPWNELVRQFFIDAVAEIRKVDKRHVLMVSDYNAGWGSALPITWDGYYDVLDPDCRNTAFSIHVSHQQMDVEFGYYSQWFRNTATSKNLCLLFGEIETEGGLMTDRGMQNLMDLFDETRDSCHFSGCLWRPRSDEINYVSLWKDWVKKYATPAPAPVSRFVSEAENFAITGEETASLTKNSALFGSYVVGTGIVLNAGLPANRYYEGSLLLNRAYPAGAYTLTVQAYGDPTDSGGFILGYRTLSGKIYQVGTFEGNSEAVLYSQTVRFTAEEPIVSLVYFGTDAERKSVAIDRAILIGKDGLETVRTTATEIAPVSVIHTLEGTELDPAAELGPGTPAKDDGSAAGSEGALNTLQILMIVMLCMAALVFAAIIVIALLLRRRKKSESSGPVL